MIKEIYYILLSLFTLSCGIPSDQHAAAFRSNNTLVVLDPDEIKNTLIYNSSSYFEELKVIVLETTERSLIGHLSKLDAYNKQVIILDKFVSKGVFIFDEDGRFIRRIGQPDNSPGGYGMPMDFTLDREQGHIYVLDGHTQKINKYDINTGEL